MSGAVPKPRPDLGGNPGRHRREDRRPIHRRAAAAEAQRDRSRAQSDPREPAHGLCRDAELGGDQLRDPPLKRYPDTYNGKPLCFAGLASTKSGYSLYLTCTYQDRKVLACFQKAVAKAGKKLDMGKSCVRFKRLEDLPLEGIAEVIAMVPVDAFIARYEKVKQK